MQQERLGAELPGTSLGHGVGAEALECEKSRGEGWVGEWLDRSLKSGYSRFTMQYVEAFEKVGVEDETDIADIDELAAFCVEIKDELSKG